MSMPNDLNLSIYRRRSVSGDYSAYKLDPQHRCHWYYYSHRVKLSDVTAPYALVLSISINTRLCSNLRPTTRECVHICDGIFTLPGSGVVIDNSFTLWDGDFGPFVLLWPWPWSDDLHIRTWLDSVCMCKYELST